MTVTGQPDGTEAAFSYELRLDVGGSTPIMVGIGAAQDNKNDIDAIYMMLLDFAEKSKLRKLLMADNVGVANVIN